METPRQQQGESSAASGTGPSQTPRTPTADQASKYDDVLRSLPEADITTVFTALNHLLDTHKNDADAVSSVSQHAVRYLDGYLKASGGDRGTLIPKDIEDYLISLGANAQTANATGDDDDDEEEDGDGDYDPAAPANNPGTGGVVVVDDTGDDVAAAPQVDKQMYSVAVLQQYNMTQGNGDTIENPIIVGSEGTDRWSDCRLDFSADVSRDDMQARKTAFVTDNFEKVHQIQYKGQMKWARLHPYTLFKWADLFFTAVDAQGIKNLRQVLKGFQLSDSSGIGGGTILRAKQLAATTKDVALQRFYQAFHLHLEAESKKDHFWYYRKTATQFEMYEQYDRLVARLAKPKTNVAKFVNQYERETAHMESRNSVGRGNRDRIKSYLASTLNVTEDALYKSIHSGKPVHTIVKATSMGFIPLMDNRMFASLNKMAVGFADPLVKDFLERNPEISAITETLYDHMIEPMRSNDSAALQALQAAATADIPKGCPVADAIATMFAPATAAPEAGQAAQPEAGPNDVEMTT